MFCKFKMKVIKNFIDQEVSPYFMERCLNEIPFQEVEYRKGRKLPRLCFRYDGFNQVGVLEELKVLVETKTQEKVGGIWCNLYRNGEDYTPQHQDSYQANVFTISLGETRFFHIHPLNGALQKEKYKMECGDAFYFTKEENLLMKHSVPKSKTYKGQRISIVFFTR